MSPTLQAFIEYITVERALSPNTIEWYRGDLVQFEEFLKKEAIQAKTEDVVAFLSPFQNRHTMNRKLSSINAFFDFCVKEEFLTDKPKVKQSKVPQSLPKFLSFDFIRERIDALSPNDWLGLRDKALVMFLYATGARVSEAMNAKRGDIEEGWLRIRMGKGEKERLVPVAKPSLDLLDTYLQARKKSSDYLWVNYQGKPLSRISIFNITKKLLGVSPHVLRHSFATSLVLGGADLRVVQELLGHASIVTTQVYTHIQKQNIRETVLRYHPLAQQRKAG